ncbi:MAG: hypothetical protein OXC12_06945 [Spirochaetaceae bacterium]|nr:hypothetical protein [Spirochaetaceae bacterium]
MSTDKHQHRLAGLEPGNLLAFLALLGLLRSLEEAEPAWFPRVAWTVGELPTRPVLNVAVAAGKETIAAAADVGVTRLASRHEFGPYKDLKLAPETACQKLRSAAAAGDRYLADLWAALVSDAVVRERNKATEVEPTPLCLMFGQGHQHFLERLSAVPRERQPPDRKAGRAKVSISETACLREALFTVWSRPDATQSFRWDPHEDVRYALRATDPSDYKTQHGANRLAAIGLSAITVVPQRRHAGTTRLAVLGGSRNRASGSFSFTWPIWREPASLAAIRSLLGHSGLADPDPRASLGIVELRRTRRISFGRFVNFTRADAVP